MKGTKRICIFLYGCMCLIVLGSLSDKLYREKHVMKLPDKNTTKQVLPSSNTKNNRFVVEEEGDFLVVYYISNHIKYLSTDISVSQLPAKIQENIKDGLEFENEKTLYDFLENYSS